MALLGSSVDPRLFVQDYSGFVRAAEIQSQGMQNLGAAIGQGIKDFGEDRQERKKLDAQIKADSASIESAIKLGDSLGIDIKSYLAPIQAKINDPNTTPMEAAAYGRAAAQGISNAFTLGIGAQERQSAAERAMVDARYRMADLAIKGERLDVARMQAEKGPTPKFELRKPQITSPTGEVLEGPELPYDVNRGMFFDTKVQKHIKDVNLIGTGQEYAPEKPAMPTPTSQVGDGAADLISGAANGTFNISYKTRDKLPASSPTSRQISLDFNAAPNKNAKGIEIIIPNNATDEERQRAQEYVAKTKQYFAERGVNVPVRGVRTAKENGRGTPNRFHTEPFFVGDAASRAVMEKDPDGYAQVLASTLGRIPGAMFIPPHKSNDPGASDGKFNERDFAKGSIIPALERLSKQKSAQANPAGIDNAISMTGDMTQQAMGTPEQQAMLSQQIEQGAGMAMAQNVSQGAMTTEPSMATQQPQLPQQAAPQWSPPPGFAPVKPKGNKPTTTMSAEQVQNLVSQGYRVNAIPNADGTFAVSGVTTGGSSSGFEVTTPEGTTVRYGGAGGLTQPKVGQGLQLVPDPTSPTGTRAVPVPGGEAEKAAQQEAAAAEIEKARGVELGLVAIAEIDNFINYTDKMSKLPFASPVRKAFGAFGMEEQAEAQSSLDTVTANLKFEALSALRKSSPSGASGLGQVTQNEFTALADQWGALKLTGDPEKIKERAIRVKKQLLDIVHGSQKHRDLLLKKSVITEQQYNEIQSQYPGSKVASQEDANLSRWRKAFTPQPTQ